MTNYVFLFIYLNMGCEMLYIIKQRLLAQNICKSQSNKVLNDILIEMFNEQFIEKIKNKTYPPDKLTLKQMFSKLAHSSIMKLNEASMSKLFDIILMVFKYQLMSINQTVDLFQITLNHLDGIKDFTDKKPIFALIILVKNKLLLIHATFGLGKLQFTRQLILNYLIGLNVRISILLQIGVQKENGKFFLPSKCKVNCFCQMPSQITFYDLNGHFVRTLQFEQQNYCEFDLSPTDLGSNIYEKKLSLCEKYQNENFKNEDTNNELNKSNEKSFNQEVQLLANLLSDYKIDKDETETKTNKQPIWFDLLEFSFDENKSIKNQKQTKEDEKKMNKNESKNDEDNEEQVSKQNYNQKIFNLSNNLSKLNLEKIEQDLESIETSLEQPLSLLQLLDS